MVEPVRPRYQGYAHAFERQTSDTDPRQGHCLPRHSIIISDQFADPLLNVQCKCLADSCEHDGNLIFFEIDVPPLEDLLQAHRKKTINQMVVFLAQINLFLAISNTAMEFFASKAEVREYKKGALVLEEKDFPLAKFFIVKAGRVNLYKRVVVERANFMPTTKKTYQKRCYRKSVPHCLGQVLPRQYFGIEECLMDMQAGQLPCPLARAAEDSTLIFFSKTDFVDTFTKAQMEDVLELIKAQTLIPDDVAPEELVLRTMHRDQVKEMCKPRARVYLDRDTPRRVKKIIDHHQKVSAAYAQQIQHAGQAELEEEKAPGDQEPPLFDPTSRMAQLKTYTEAKSQVLPRDKYGRAIVPKQKVDYADDAKRLQPDIQRADFQVSQGVIRDQKAHCALNTLEGLFKRDNWTVMGYKTVKGLINDTRPPPRPQ